ncbi:VRR-NUC domain-containing protein [Vibrio splendidus]|uniref:VRR-NUC domain-containing protein n=1 Tax=Vibrio splendidus TaxID=29497 RepID=UPI000C86757D|nr:VRR-NUC domain-containing protein [Vibrio splendidus]PMP01309.1 nuclease [Vibrio splendidus]PMP27382.1 nuclease [Vibrio splendidus]PMP35937.1 nuclease [Vibrio splendidus]PMP40875.1 nuclease [Vibrio splendidus]PMP49111.1 nuclease [Vibrio splendidus]
MYQATNPLTIETTLQLSSTYYLDNFNRLVEHAQTLYTDLLSDDECRWLSAYKRLSVSSQCLMVRLFSRKGRWFRSDKLNYVEISDLNTALQELSTSGFIALSHPAEQHDLVISNVELGLHLLTKPELLSIFPALKNHRTAKKDELLLRLEQQPFDQFQNLNFDCIYVVESQVIDVLLLLFFANTYQDLSQFVLSDLGLNTFENYPLSKQRRFFTSRDQLNQLLQMRDVQRLYSEGDRKDSEFLEQLLQSIPAESEHRSIARKRSRLINDIARDLERLNLNDQAVFWFRQSTLPPSRERLARIYDKQDELDLMCDIVTKIKTVPSDVSELEVAIKLEDRLLRKQGHKVPRASKPNCEQIKLELDLSQTRVELAVKQHFEDQGWDVYFSENSFLCGLFGLAFWEVIFADAEGAFINRYQHRPLDLYHSDFVDKRAEQVEAVFQTLSKHGLNHLLNIYDEKRGIANPFVHWNYFPRSLVEHSMVAIPNALIVDLFKVILSDLKLFRTGMPDLIAFKDKEFHWVEVKGPGDKLQDNQWRWIKEFERLSVPFSVCYVNQ